MEQPTLFTWGYYGWGNATPQLVEAVDAVETSRGFEPPLFVDIRIVPFEPKVSRATLSRNYWGRVAIGG